MSQFDDRIFEIHLTWGNGKEIILDGGFNISAQGAIYSDSKRNECNLEISNLRKEYRDNLATQLTPWNLDQTKKSIKVRAGRISTGLFDLFIGDIAACSPSQPPDIGLKIRAKTSLWYSLNLTAQAESITAPLSSIGGSVAASMGLSYNFQATDKSVTNYSYNGTMLGQVDALNALGGIEAYIDNGSFIIKDKGTALKGLPISISASTGMIGIPEPTEYGVRIITFLNQNVKVGGLITLDAKSNPLLNGNYMIYRVQFDISSRDTPFYTIIEASKWPLAWNNAVLPS